MRKAKALGAAPDETVTSKTIVPPTGDKRTYMSLATYCWPSNPEDLENPKGPWNCKDAVPFPGVCTQSYSMSVTRRCTSSFSWFVTPTSLCGCECIHGSQSLFLFLYVSYPRYTQKSNIFLFLSTRHDLRTIGLHIRLTNCVQATVAQMPLCYSHH